MKNPKKLTYNERRIVESWGLDPSVWKRAKLTATDLLLYNPVTNEHKSIPARVKGR